MRGPGSLLYGILIVIQFFAIWDGAEVWWGFNIVLAAIVGLLLAWIPVVGSAIALWAALDIWRWDWWWAVALFVGPWIAILLIAMIRGRRVGPKGRLP